MGPVDAPKDAATIGAQIEAVYETHLPVADLSRSIAFYRDVLGLELASQPPERGVAFFWVGARATGMLGLWHAGSAPLRMTLHCAFRMPKASLLRACAELAGFGVQPLGFHGEPVEEPVVIGWMPALSVYFKDPDGHSLELIHVLDEAPDPDFGFQPCSKWREAHSAAR